MKSILPLLAAVLVLAGCATSDVAPMGQNTFMVTRHVWGFYGPTPIKAELLKIAGDYCKSHGKELLVTKTVEVGLKFGSEPYSEVYFKALDPDDPELKKPHTIEEVVR